MGRQARNGGSSRNFEACVRDWLNAKRTQVGTRTWRDYEEKAARWVLPLLGSIPVHRLGARQIVTLHTALQREGLSPRTIRYAHQIVDHALEHALRRRLIRFNPARLTRPASRPSQPVRRLRTAELIQFLEVAREDSLAALWFLLALTGMQPAEALGLRWELLDLSRKLVRVDGVLRALPGRRWQRIASRHGGQVRAIPLPDTLVDLLRRHRIQQERDRTAAGTRWRDWGLIFTARTGEPLRWATITRLRFKPLLREAGLPDVPAFSLRHSSVAAQLEQGEDLRTIARRTGYVSLAAMLGTYRT
jgi:integrase